MGPQDCSDVRDLLTAAAAGSQSAWNKLVDRYLPLVFSVTRTFRLSDEDAHDVSQTLWLRLVENLGTIREPRALPGWIITTTKREAFRVLAARERMTPVDPSIQFDVAPPDAQAIEEGLLASERRQALRDALNFLKPKDRQLVMLLIADPPLSYADIAARLGIPLGSIGPTRARCLAKLRSAPQLARLLVTLGETNPEGDDHGEFVRV
jgi:RNA polymerase sigma factor (sigma-70 family)